MVEIQLCKRGFKYTLLIFPTRVFDWADVGMPILSHATRSRANMFLFTRRSEKYQQYVVFLRLRTR